MKQLRLLSAPEVEPAVNSHSQVIVLFMEAWKREKGGGTRAPMVVWKRDGRIVKDLLKQYPAEYVERLIRIFLTRRVFFEDKYCVEQGWGIPAFLARVNLCISLEAGDKPRAFVQTHHIPTRETKKRMSKEELRVHLESVGRRE